MIASSLCAVEPVRPIAPYVGGKRYLARRLTALIEETPHTTYAEPFVGMGGIFLRRRRRPPSEIINDLSGDVSNLFRVLQVHYVPFIDMLRFQVASRPEFDRLMRVDPETLTDLQRAARFLFLQRNAFGGKVTGRNFAMVRDRPSRFDLVNLAPELEALHDRLSGVTIERLDWAVFVRRYDGEGTLFYLDPPYFACEGDYGADLFERGQFETMAEVLAQLKGRFILSLNDRPEVRRIFAEFEIEAVGTHYGVAGGGAQPAREVIIRGGG